MKEILFAADTIRECNEFMNNFINVLLKKGIRFDIDKYKMSLKTEFAHLVCIAKTSSNSGLLQKHSFDYHILTGDAMFDGNGFHDFCISKTKIKSEQIERWDKLIKVMKGESE